MRIAAKFPLTFQSFSVNYQLWNFLTKQKKTSLPHRFVLKTVFTMPVPIVHIMRHCTRLLQVQADFSGELIKRRKIYPAKLKSYLYDMQLVRNKADYSDENISRQRADKWLSRIKEMIELIEYQEIFA